MRRRRGSRRRRKRRRNQQGGREEEVICGDTVDIPIIMQDTPEIRFQIFPSFPDNP